MRSATVDDAALIADLSVVVQRLHHEARPGRFRAPAPRLFEETLRQWLAGDDVRAFIAEQGDARAVGYVLAVRRRRPENPLTSAADFIELDQIAVLPECEGRGVGRALAGRVFELAAELGVSRVELSVWEFNTHARRFFTSLGFVPMQRRMSVDLSVATEHP